MSFLFLTLKPFLGSLTLKGICHMNTLEGKGHKWHKWMSLMPFPSKAFIFGMIPYKELICINLICINLICIIYHRRHVIINTKPAFWSWALCTESQFLSLLYEAEHLACTYNFTDLLYEGFYHNLGKWQIKDWQIVGRKSMCNLTCNRHYIRSGCLTLSCCLRLKRSSNLTEPGWNSFFIGTWYGRHIPGCFTLFIY